MTPNSLTMAPDVSPSWRRKVEQWGCWPWQTKTRSLTRGRPGSPPPGWPETWWGQSTGKPQRSASTLGEVTGSQADKTRPGNALLTCAWQEGRFGLTCYPSWNTRWPKTRRWGWCGWGGGQQKSWTGSRPMCGNNRWSSRGFNTKTQTHRNTSFKHKMVKL